jgi:tetratricopeptide (TPR) repeat protein
MKEGECYQTMGDTKRALGLYESILSQPDDEAFRKLKNSTMHLAMKCWVADSEKKYDIAIDKAQKWLASAHPSDERSPDGIGVRYFLAVAEKNLADSLKKPDEQGRKKAALADARKQAGMVKKLPSMYQDAATELYMKISPDAVGDENAEPTNFVDARDRGKDSLEQWQAKLQAISAAPAMKDQANVPKYQKEAAELRAQALQYFRLAMELRDEETPIEDVNIVRYYLCFLAYQSGEYYDAAVMGEFLARNYPESSGGRQCAKIAMSAYQQGYLSPQKIETDFDKQKMVEIADYITRRWAGQEEADEAWTTLMSIAVFEKELDKATEYLDKIAADSPRRGSAELRLGQALWAGYLNASRLDDQDRPPQAELDAMVAKAKTTLEDGVKRMRAQVDSGAAPVSATLASALLSLGQIYVDSGQSEKALELLNDPKTGPLTLVKANDPATKQGNYAIEAYKLALRGYVATEALDKAEQSMNELEKLANASGDANTAETLTRIYVALGHELQEQVTRLRQENKTEELAKVSKGFELFLERISSRESGNDFRSLNWVADTFYNLGSGYDAGGGASKLAPQAKSYYEKSIKTDERLLADAKKKKGFVSDENLLFGIQLRMARSYRRLGDFNKAISLLSDILKQKPMLVEVQREAAQTLQDWGATRPDFYTLAIRGAKTYKTPEGRQEKLIWGWGTMAVKVQSDKKLADTFHEARYNQAKCHMEQARSKTDASEKSVLLAKAEKDITFTQTVRPDLGGPDWRKKYDSLFKAIQQLQGKKPTGLPSEKPTASSARSPAKAAPSVKPAVKPAVAGASK